MPAEVLPHACTKIRVTWPMVDCWCAACRPRRVQLSRARGWRKPDDTIVVSRPGRFGNMFVCPDDPQRAVDAFRGWLTTHGTFRLTLGDGLSMARVPAWHEAADLRDALPGLRGKHLACWCALDAPCHADVLLELANRPPCPGGLELCGVPCGCAGRNPSHRPKERP